MLKMFTLFKIPSVHICIFCLCLMVIIRESNARPPWLSPGSGVFTESAECHTDAARTQHLSIMLVYFSATINIYILVLLSSMGGDELLDLCQRCAKLTKSKLAYPACCSTDLQARRWCSDYVYFGRGQYDFY